MSLISHPVRQVSALLPCFLAICICTICTCPCISLAQPGAHHGVLLAVAPIPTATNPSPRTPQVTWSTGNGTPGTVTVSSNGLKEAFFAWGTEGTALAPWLSAGRSYVFRLYSIAPTRRLLARLQVNKTTSLEVLALPQAPRTTSPVENRLLELLSYGFIAVLALLAAMYVREVRHGV